MTIWPLELCKKKNFLTRAFCLCAKSPDIHVKKNRRKRYTSTHYMNVLSLADSSEFLVKTVNFIRKLLFNMCISFCYFSVKRSREEKHDIMLSNLAKTKVKTQTLPERVNKYCRNAIWRTSNDCKPIELWELTLK